ncbi:MAG TPA: alpha/beta hydrolase [Steroidobacteraceae bacterium]|jgi:pimeloyl-ACP methyl ester carboxylesterase|nr:alpha/beta hydrolase [Steroidobacteraceae bacterium]
MPKVSPSRPAATAQSRLRRGYFECRYGQLHVHNAIPAGGGFEEGTPLLCLHPIPHSGRIFSRFLTVTGVGRSVFAPDLPGFGESDPPPPHVGVTEHAAAIGDFLETMRLRQVDLLGQGFGAAVAAELSATRPAQVRRLVLVSPPLPSDAAEPSPMTPAMDGSHLPEEWRRAVAYCGPAASAEVATAALADRLRNGAQAGAAAARAYQLRTRLTQLSVPLLVLRLGGEVVANKAQARDMPARARLVELPERDASLFETAPEVAAQAVESFLR